MRTYQISPYSLQSLLRDVPGKDVPQPVQTLYLNEVMGFFLRTLVKVYARDELSDKDKANLRRYLEKIISAKESIDGKFDGGNTLPRIF